MAGESSREQFLREYEALARCTPTELEARIESLRFEVEIAAGRAAKAKASAGSSNSFGGNESELADAAAKATGDAFRARTLLQLATDILSGAVLPTLTPGQAEEQILRRLGIAPDTSPEKATSLIKHLEPYRGNFVRLVSREKRFGWRRQSLRTTHCLNCREPLYNAEHVLECYVCSAIICPRCTSCGCGDNRFPYNPTAGLWPKDEDPKS